MASIIFVVLAALIYPLVDHIEQRLNYQNNEPVRRLLRRMNEDSTR